MIEPYLLIKEKLKKIKRTNSLKKINNITVVISRNNFYRNFFYTDAFKDLDEKFSVSYVLSNHLPRENSKRRILYFQRNLDISTTNLFGYRTFLLMYRAKHKSKTFKFRIERMLYPLKFDIKYIPNFHILKTRDKIKKTILFLIKTIINNLKYIKLKILSVEFIFKIFSNKFYHVNHINKSFENALLNTNPDLILVPFGSQQLELQQVVSFCKKNHIKSYFITDNWDNISSKSIIEDKPDFIGVWGEQAKKHAIEIQNFSQNQIFLIGSPRFDIIYERRNKDLQKNNQFDYILFLGHLFDWNEEEVIKILDNEISSRKNIYKNTKIIYRPHPQRGSRMRTSNLPNIIVDKDVVDKGNYWPSLTNYFNNIQNSKFVMGSLTTGLLEATAYYKRYLLFCYKDDYDFFSQGSLLNKYTHVEDLNKIHTLEFCDKKEDIIKKFHKLFQESENNKKIQVDREINYFIAGDINRSFRKNLTESIFYINKNL